MKHVINYGIKTMFSKEEMLDRIDIDGNLIPMMKESLSQVLCCNEEFNIDNTITENVITNMMTLESHVYAISQHLYNKLSKLSDEHIEMLLCANVKSIERAIESLGVYAMVNGVNLTREQYDNINSQEVQQYIKEGMKRRFRKE